MKALEELTVLDAEGTAVSVASFWMTGPAVLVFVRHFG